MADGEVSARDRRVDPVAAGSPVVNIAGQAAIRDLLRVQDATRPRSLLARVFGWSPLSLTGRAAYRAAVGEVEVGDALDALGEHWHVLHSVRVSEDGTEIDHLVIGPSGVYVVATAVHPGGVVEASQRTFMVSDIRYPHIRNMEYEMGRVERLLSTAAGVPVEVSAILAVVDPKSLTVREAHRDVAVLASSAVTRWLTGRTTVLQPAEVAAFARVAALPETWQVDGAAAGDTTDLRARFDELRREVTRAWSLQRVWASAVTVLGAGAFILVTYSILVTALGSASN